MKMLITLILSNDSNKIYVITIPKWRTAVILDSGKNSHNFAQDWGNWLKFRMLVQNDTLNWINWPAILDFIKVPSSLFVHYLLTLKASKNLKTSEP